MRNGGKDYIACEKSRVKSAASGKPHGTVESHLGAVRGQGPRWNQPGDVGKTLKPGVSIRRGK